MRWRLRDALERFLERLWYGEKTLTFVLLFIPFGLASLAWRFGASQRRRARAVKGPIPTIGVGNLVVGGSGKTQVVLELARRGTERGLRMALIGRGHGGTLTASTVVDDKSSSALVGDEACLLARRSPGALVVAGTDRSESAELAARAGARLAVLDDGLQQRRLEVDRRIWIFPAARPFGNGHLLPLGPLRDSLSAIAPQDLIWVHGEGTAQPSLRVDVRSHSRTVGLVSAHDLGDAPRAAHGMRVAAFCGIARPERFLTSLREAGAIVSNFWARADHRVFTSAELLHAAKVAEAAGAAALVCTEKDAVRLPVIALSLPVFALRIELTVSSGGELVDQLFDDLLTRA